MKTLFEFPPIHWSQSVVFRLFLIVCVNCMGEMCWQSLHGLPTFRATALVLISVWKGHLHLHVPNLKFPRFFLLTTPVSL